MDLVAVKKEHDGQQYDADQDIGLTDRDMKLIGNTDPEQCHRITSQVYSDGDADAEPHDQ